MTRDGPWFIVGGLLVILFGVSYIAWGNWIPIGVTMNNPTVAGIYTIVVGAALAALGVWEAWADRA